jgi:hypothetical protein
MEKGIKETQEMVLAILEVAEALGPILSDGFQASKDLPAMFAEFQSNVELQAKVAAAVEKANEVPLELKDLDTKEILQLLIVILPELPKVIDAWKKIEIKPVGAPVA